MHIGQRIKQLVESEKMTPGEFSKLLGKKSRGSAYDIWDREDINTKDLRKIAEHFGVSMSSFFEDKTKKEPETVTNSTTEAEIFERLYREEREKNEKLARANQDLLRKKPNYDIAAEG